MIQHCLGFAGWTGVVVGQAVTPALPEIGALTQAGALGILAWVVWTQRQEQRDARQQQHDDSERLNSTLTDLRIHCAKKESAAAS
jgi:flagellar biosynthesis component FlhA